MQRIKHLSLSPALEAALAESMGAKLPRPRHFFMRSTVALLAGLVAVLVALAALLIHFIHR